MKDKILGCLIGGAIGDCMGGSYEGDSQPISFSYDHVWRFSDDTQLTSATCEAIIAYQTISPEKIAETFKTWFEENKITGIGASTYKALRELSVGAHWALAGRKGEMAAGNGAAMRIAPLAFCLNPTDSEDRTIIRDVSRITHHNDEAYAGALAVLLAIWLNLQRSTADKLPELSLIIQDLPDSIVRDKLKEIATLKNNISIAEVADRFGNSGYVADSIPIALFCVQKIPEIGFESALIELVSTGGDTDTNASIAGQIGGSFIGLKNIPEFLISKCPKQDSIENIFKRFSSYVSLIPSA